jgi:hypothetical protein
MRASAPRSAHAAREGFATAGLARLMASKLSKHLSKADFASLLTVGNTCAVLEPPAVIPVERSARLVVALGYKAPNDYARQSADSSGIRKQAATATGAALRCSTENQKGLRLELFRRGRLVFTRTGLFQCWGEAPMGTPPCHPSGV